MRIEMEIKKGWTYQMVNPSWYWSERTGHFCKVMAYTSPNVHIRWRDRMIHCFNEDLFRDYFILPETQKIANILELYGD